ncbi:MAG: beta(1,3)galactosyltransferase EpsH [Lachnospiraceae bacterium]|nr:beta(1,3)galactosyltransferase EpsH [Lachnospiraceae bacterium]
MIFVTVGSQKFPFNRLIKKVDEMIRDRIIAEEVFMQTGASDYRPACCGYQTFCDRAEFEKWLDRCDIIITHGGAGAMIGAVRRKKKTIAVPRLARYGEHVDDHQCELAKRLHAMNLLYACPDTNRLPEALKTVREHRYAPFSSNTEAFIASVDDFIRSL